MNFIEAFKKGQQGRNMGLSTGLLPLDRSIDRIQQRSIYGIAAAPKVGKTTFADMCFVLEPYLYLLELKQQQPDNPIDVEWIYFSFEINRVKKEFKYAAYFMYRDYGISTFIHKGKSYTISPRYLEGRMADDDNELIMVQPDHLEKIKEIYEKRIVPLFGRYDTTGRCVQRGVIQFIEQRDNPTGMRNYLLHYARQHGEFINEEYTTRENGESVKKSRIIGYKPNNPMKFTIIITDHVRKLVKERGYTLKENIDKWIEYSVELRNWCSFTFVHIVHLNRSISDINRMKYMTEHLHPTGEDVKDTGNLSEEVDYMFTLFNPRDEKYNLTKHFGLVLANYPYYRSLHLVESRDTDCPNHMQLNMYGNINLFTEI